MRLGAVLFAGFGGLAVTSGLVVGGATPAYAAGNSCGAHGVLTVQGNQGICTYDGQEVPYVSTFAVHLVWTKLR